MPRHRIRSLDPFRRLFVPGPALLGGSGGETPLIYLLRDEFTTAESAPLTSPRTCEPGPGTVTVVDPQNNLNISGGSLLFGGGAAAAFNGCYGPSQAKTAGHAFLVNGEGGISSRLYAGISMASSLTGGTPFGFDYLGTTWIKTDSPAGGVVCVTGASGIKSLLAILRSYGAFFIIDGVLYWVDKTPAATGAYPRVSTYGNASGTTEVEDISYLSLPANGYTAWDADFSTVTDSKTNVGSTIGWDCEADSLTRTVFTMETAKNVYIYTRYADASNWVRWRAREDTGALEVAQSVAGNITNLITGIVAGFANGVAYTVDMLCEGTSVKVFVDNVLRANVTCDAALINNEGGYCIESLTGTVTSVTTHPYPALGIATDRVVCPQDNATFIHENDFLCYIRGAHVPTAGDDRYDFRITDANNKIYLLIASTGQPVIREIIGGAVNTRITGSVGGVSEGDDLAIIVAGNKVSLYVNGIQVGSTATLTTILTGTAAEAAVLQNTYGPDSIEFFPRDVTSLLPSELV